MYFANMYCYGWDHNAVGITGIRGCMGAVYRGAHALYAVHIPDHGAQDNRAGADAFAQWVRGFEAGTGTKGDLYVFANGINRPSAEHEAKHLKSALHAKHATVYRVMQHLGPDSGGNQADSASILVRSGAHIDLLYKHVPDDQYIAGGRAESGQYKVRAAFQGNAVPSDYLAPVGWYPMTGANVRRIKIKWW